MANPTLKYVAYKDVEYGDPVHEDIRHLKESQKHKEACKATSYALGKQTFFKTTTFHKLPKACPRIDIH